MYCVTVWHGWRSYQRDGLILYVGCALYHAIGNVVSWRRSTYLRRKRLARDGGETALRSEA